MDFLTVLSFLFYFILCMWWVVWGILFILEYRHIKEYLHHKDYLGILGNSLMILGIVLFLIIRPFSNLLPISLFILIFVGGWIVLIWVIWSTVNIINKIEEVKDNIAIFVFSNEIFVGLLYFLFFENPYARFILFIILLFLHFFWTGKMMHTLINIGYFQEKKELREIEITVRERGTPIEREPPIVRKPPIVPKQRAVKKRKEVSVCPLCSNKLSKRQRKRYKEGQRVYCTYCGIALE